MAVAGHVALVTMMLRARKKETQEKQALLNAILTGKSTEIDEELS